MTGETSSPGIASTLWAYTERSIERLVALAESMSDAQRARVPGFPGANSVATLVGHTIGNAEDNWLGTLLEREGVYERAADFERPEVRASAIRERWERLRSIVASGLADLDDTRMLSAREHPRRGTITGLEVALVVARHAAEHLAHAEMTRDILRSTD